MPWVTMQGCHYCSLKDESLIEYHLSQNGKWPDFRDCINDRETILGIPRGNFACSSSLVPIAHVRQTRSMSHELLARRNQQLRNEGREGAREGERDKRSRPIHTRRNTRTCAIVVALHKHGNDPAGRHQCVRIDRTLNGRLAIP